jgi:hypothetical protein
MRTRQRECIVAIGCHCTGCRRLVFATPIEEATAAEQTLADATT